MKKFRDPEVLMDDGELEEAMGDMVLMAPVQEARMALEESQKWDATLGDKELTERLFALFEYPLAKSVAPLNVAAGPLKRKNPKIGEPLFEEDNQEGVIKLKKQQSKKLKIGVYWFTDDE